MSRYFLGETPPRHGEESSAEDAVGGRGATIDQQFLSGAAEIALGGSHSCARLTDATVRCWGANVVGQLGREWSISTPVAVIGLGM